LDERARAKKNPAYYRGLGGKTRSAREKQFSRQSDMHWDDPEAYKLAPGDDKPTKTSKWTKIANKRFPRKDEGESMEIKESVLREMIREAIEMIEAEELEGLDELDEAKSNASQALKNKAKSANAPLGALRAIYNKGLAAWRTGHRPGAGQHQWAMARVNSVLAGGPARKVDAAQWKQIQQHRKKKRG
jgi:hypothetical protein